MRGLSAAAGPGGRFTSEEPGVFMAGWNVCSEHVMNLQRANEWIYFEPTVSELITAAKETFGGTGRGEVALGTQGARGRCPALAAPAPWCKAGVQSCCLEELV